MSGDHTIIVPPFHPAEHGDDSAIGFRRRRVEGQDWDVAQQKREAWKSRPPGDTRSFPPHSVLEAVRALPDFAGWTIGVVEIDPGLFTL